MNTSPREAELAALRTSIDEAGASVERGEGIEITAESLHELKRRIIQRCRARLEAERRAG
jgi:hypothetical protein